MMASFELIETGYVEMEIQPAATDHSPQGFEARVNGAPFPSSDDRLRFANPRSELGLRQSRSESGFFDQIATHHGFKIVHICYRN